MAARTARMSRIIPLNVFVIDQSGVGHVALIVYRFAFRLCHGIYIAAAMQIFRCFAVYPPWVLHQAVSNTCRDC